MDVNKAWEKAKASEKQFNIEIKKMAWDDGKYFIFAVAGNYDISPLGVNKETGDVDIYFPFDHIPEFDKAVRVL